MGCRRIPACGLRSPSCAYGVRREGGTPLTNETELLAWTVLRAANRTQARDTTVRLVVPRAPEVAGDLEDMEIAEERLLTAEEWLVDRGYLAPADVVLTRGTYTITPAGFEWLRGGMPEPLEAPQKAAEDVSDPKPTTGGAEASADSERVPWWRRVFGG
jgi:hypothetical protein